MTDPRMPRPKDHMPEMWADLTPDERRQIDEAIDTIDAILGPKIAAAAAEVHRLVDTKVNRRTALLHAFLFVTWPLVVAVASVYLFVWMWGAGTSPDATIARLCSGLVVGWVVPLALIAALRHR